MSESQFQWSMPPIVTPPDGWQQALGELLVELGGEARFVNWIGPILWQRGWREMESLRGFLNPAAYAPTPPAGFGPEMERAIARLVTAHANQAKVAIWGDFDADGLTATAVLWEGLGQFFAPETTLRYYVPNRFTESHGLSRAGLDALAAWGCTLIVTCDTGSTAHAELDYAQALGMEVIVTDHHTLPDTRPPVVALVNPRQLPSTHPLADLSGVAVAYKLVEGLYTRLPDVPRQSLETLLDLVAIGLIADLVVLRGDCRYLTQIGLQQLEQQAKAGVRPGIAKLLEFCKRTGDRPSDVAFGLGPRINAVSRIHGDAHFGVELLTSRDRDRAAQLALDAELANTRRKELQATVMRQASDQLAQLDLSTTQVILLSDPQWSPGVLGLVASQIAQTYGRPTILFQTETTPADGAVPMARGSARSVNRIDLYELVQGQSHLLTSFGGHPYAAGLTLPVANLPLLADGMNRSLRSLRVATDLTQPPPLTIDLEVTVADLGKDLFKALKLLEPYGMGNPIPRLLLRQVEVDNLWENALRDKRGGKQRYYKLSFDLRDPESQATFPGHWWGHRRQDLPAGRYDLVVELDTNTYKKRYEARLIDRRPAAVVLPPAATVTVDWIVDHRQQPERTAATAALAHCPTDWSDFVPYRQSPPLTLAYPRPSPVTPATCWQQWIGMAKYLARTGESRVIPTLCTKLNLDNRTWQIGLGCLEQLGFGVYVDGDSLRLTPPVAAIAPAHYEHVAQRFVSTVQEMQFRRQYFYEVSPATLQQVLGNPQ